jgi:cyclopropane-fatty-acyl-phospholipid synthase
MSSRQAVAHDAGRRHGDRVLHFALDAAERGWLPDAAIRSGIREFCRRRLRGLSADPEQRAEQTARFIRGNRSGLIAVGTDEANHQHYEVPSEFFALVLGPALKYSCCYFAAAKATLSDAEQASLDLTCSRAGLADGQRILELGCGWGSLTLHMAERYPNAAITAVSNSHTQREHIAARAAQRGIDNIQLVTSDINDFVAEGAFDRVVSVEMFEHVRNHALLLERIAGWLVPDGKLFVHIFCSGQQPYAFEDAGADDWMARNFFSGGVMPSDDLLLRYQGHLVLRRQWRWSGKHYQRTADAWLARLDSHRAEVEAVFRRAGARDPAMAARRWRIFFMACSELFGFDHGRRWWVSHYQFDKR